MKLKYLFVMVLALVITAAFTLPASAGGITVYKEGEKFVKIGGRIQLQYHSSDEDPGDTTDSVFFRRFRPYIIGSLHKDWKGIFQFDLGSAADTNEIALKEVWMAYTGFKNITIKLGNAQSAFSREDITSSKKQHLIERTFVGDHNYGTPERNTGLHFSGHFSDKKITWGADLAAADIDPTSSKLDFDTPVNKNSDFNQGWIGVARVDFHPLGYVGFSQGDFKRGPFKFVVGVAGYVWNNDGDNNGAAASIDDVTGFEISGGIRGHGISIDAEYNVFNADTVDPAFTGGLYTAGDTELENFSVEGGYMIIPSRLELAAGYQWQDADGYTDEWERLSFGANLFIHKHDIKLQVTYRMGEHVNGAADQDDDELFVQAQYVF